MRRPAGSLAASAIVGCDMFVVLDTNSFHGDPMLRGSNFRLMRAEQQQGALQIVIPEAVRAELPKRFREPAVLLASISSVSWSYPKGQSFESVDPLRSVPNVERRG
jgi:hypothetical protein